VSNSEVHYRAISFYLEEHPDLLNDLLKVLELRVDHTRVVDMLRKKGHLPLIKDYLGNVQKANMAEVHALKALHAVCVAVYAVCVCRVQHMEARGSVAVSQLHKLGL
jgi:hypothetical protein